jgi:hypothetical protein
MRRPGKDRTGEAYGVLRVLRAGEVASTWVVRCDACGVEWVVSNRFFAVGREPKGHLVCRRERRRQRGQIV